MNNDLQTQAVRERVSKLEAEMRFLYKHLGVTLQPPGLEDGQTSHRS